MNSYSCSEIENIVKKYGDMVYQIAFVNMKKKHITDDIYQEVFLKLIKQKCVLDSEEHLKAWLIRTTVNCCKDYWKSYWFKNIIFEEHEQVSYESSEKTGYVTDCVQRLPEKYRTVIHLYYYEEYSIKEIAVILESNENTISSLLSRGRSKLKKIMTEKELSDYEI